MAVLTVRNVPEETLRALKVRAARNGRSTEAEIRVILEEQVRPPSRLKLGSELQRLGKRFGGVDLAAQRNMAPTELADFE